MRGGGHARAIHRRLKHAERTTVAAALALAASADARNSVARCRRDATKWQSSRRRLHRLGGALQRPESACDRFFRSARPRGFVSHRRAGPSLAAQRSFAPLNDRPPSRLSGGFFSLQHIPAARRCVFGAAGIRTIPLRRLVDRADEGICEPTSSLRFFASRGRKFDSSSESDLARAARFGPLAAASARATFAARSAGVRSLAGACRHGSAHGVFALRSFAPGLECRDVSVPRTPPAVS